MKAFEKFRSFVRLIDGSDRELAYQQANQQFPSNVFHKKDKAIAIYSGECSSFVLFDRVFRFLWMTYIRGRIHQGRETLSEHSRGRQCTFVSLAALLFLAVRYYNRGLRCLQVSCGIFSFL